MRCIIEYRNIEINKEKLTYDVGNPKPNKELLKSIKEGKKIIKEIKSGKIKGYTNMDDLIKSLDEE